MKISQVFKISRGGMEARLKEEGRKAGVGGGVVVVKKRHYRCLLPPADTQALPDFTLELREGRSGTSALPETRPDQNGTRNSNQEPDQNRTRIQVLCQAKVIGLQLSSSRLRSFNWTLESRRRRDEKKKKKVGHFMKG